MVKIKFENLPMNKNASLYEQRAFYLKNSVPYQSLSLPWWVRTPEPTFLVRHGCRLEPLICGEAVFKQIEIDMRAAQRSIDLISWGFDPGMVLTRGEKSESGTRFGDLLVELATRKENPIQIEIVIWHDDLISELLMKNIPGFYGQCLSDMMSMNNGYYSSEHQEYNSNWLIRIARKEVPKIHLSTRSISSEAAGKSLSDEVVPKNITATVTKHYPAHHQKMILIDYERKVKAVGYVMGHNCITDFWDTDKHIFQDCRRERFYKRKSVKYHDELRGISSGSVSQEYEMRRKQKLEDEYQLQHSCIAKPYQDVSFRVCGPILYDLNINFCQAWRDAHGAKAGLERLIDGLTAPLRPLIDPLEEKIHQSYDDGYLAAKRKAIRPEDFLHSDFKHSAQLLRTQPQYGEKSIKECYANMTRQMHHYMFIQNQYVQYKPWADLLMAHIERKRDFGYVEPMYIFIVTSTPEREGMDLSTYDVAEKVGYSHSMEVEHANRLKHKKTEGAPLNPAELSKTGVNVLMGSMWTCRKAKANEWLLMTDYEEIYIHAKVAIVDDVAFTIGSANLNVRSMAMDSELNIVSQAADVAYDLRRKLFDQCCSVTQGGPYRDMKETYKVWMREMDRNCARMKNGKELVGALVSFHVDRQPSNPVI